MPFAEFNNGNAGLALGEFMLRSQDQAMSLMERAQRMQVVQSDLDMRKEQHAADLTTTSLRQDALRAEVGKSQIDLKEAERKASELANIRDEYAAAAPRIAGSISQISKVRDFGTQRRLFNELQSQSSRFYGDPELATRLDRTFGPLQKTIEANQKSHVAQAIASNRAAPTEDIARQKFPGYHVEFATDPHTGNGVWIASDEPDRVAEARAIGLLSLAEDEADLKQAISDPTVNMMLGVPGSRASELYRTQRAKLKTESQTDAEIGVKRSAASAKASVDAGERSVPGFDGMAPTKEEATKMREISSNNLQVLDGVAEISRLSSKPGATVDQETRARIATIQAFLVGKLRLPMTGPGAFTDSEREFVKDTIGNPAKLFALSSIERAKLDELTKRLISDIDTTAAGLGLSRSKKASAGPVSGSRAQALARGASGSP